MMPAELDDILSRNDGAVTTAEANAAGVSNERLRLLANAGELERAAHGVYVLPGEFLDRMRVLQIRRRRAVYSHETALFLNGLTDRDPVRYSVTVPTGYNTSGLKRDGLNVFTVRKELLDLGRARATTVFGNEVETYDIERTVCDCVRSRNSMDAALLGEAMRRYVKRGDKNLNSLMEMAEAFRVARTLRGYLDVLL